MLEKHELTLRLSIFPLLFEPGFLSVHGGTLLLSRVVVEEGIELLVERLFELVHAFALRAAWFSVYDTEKDINTVPILELKSIYFCSRLLKY